MFVTSIITNQVMKLKFKEIDKITIGNINAFRDWTHIYDIVNGYMKLAENGREGDVYNQGSMRTNSVLSYILLSLEEVGWQINKIDTLNGSKSVKDPTEMDGSKIFGVEFNKTKVDQLMLEDGFEYNIQDKGLYAHTDQGKILIEFDKARFRPAEVPILLSDTKKIQKIGSKSEIPLNKIIKDQLNFFLKKENRV